MQLSSVVVPSFDSLSLKFTLIQLSGFYAHSLQCGQPQSCPPCTFCCSGQEFFCALSLLLPACCHYTNSRVREVGTVWLLKVDIAPQVCKHLGMYLGRQVGWPSAVYLIAHVDKDVFEVNFKISSLLPILFPGPQESREPGRTGTLLLRS